MNGVFWQFLNDSVMVNFMLKVCVNIWIILLTRIFEVGIFQKICPDLVGILIFLSLLKALHVPKIWTRVGGLHMICVGTGVKIYI